MSLEQDEIRAALEAVDAAHARLRAVCSDAVGNGFRVEVTERLETQDRLNRGLMYRYLGEIADPPDGPRDPDLPAGIVMSKLLWQRLRITPGAVRRRMRIAARIRPRRSLTGPVLPPELPQLAAAVEHGQVGDDHIAAVCQALDVLPSVVDDDHRDKAEHILVRHARSQDAKFVTAIGQRIADHLNPDGLFDENDRARRRGLRLAPQGPDGMSRLSGWLDPEARALLEAVHAAVRPGRHHPDKDAPEEVPDTRTEPQRLHDAVKLGLKAAIASGTFGQHRGLPVTVIATTTLRELDQAAHAVNDSSIPMPPPARTGGGSALPMRDLIRMAADAIHYLAIFDDHTHRPLYLGRTKTRCVGRSTHHLLRVIAAVRRPTASNPAITAKPTTTPTGPPVAAPTPTACSSAADPTTHWSKGILQTKVTDTGRLAWTDNTGPPAINHAHHPDELLAELYEDDEDD